jgi:ribosomal protein S18 acetylase RimI-like enzyme
MIIRGATPNDARAIAEIHVRSWQVAYKDIVPDSFLESLSVEQRERFWRQSLEGSGPGTSVIEEHGEVLGWISVGPSRDAGEEPSTRELWAIYVEPRHWRRGVGQRLWGDIEKQLKRSGVSEVTLWVLKDNTRALAFYRSNGFVDDAGIEKTVEIGETELVEVRLRKGLGG